MMIMSAKLSEKAKSIDMLTRTEGLKQYSGQGQSIESETVIQNIIFPRVRTISNRDKKVCRYPDKSLGCRIKSLLEQMVIAKTGMGK
jgi:hypothetical protein|tara:strand:- start:104 stop:364 length:261 start_codon:yes stop_codon:yes gene_type:complete